MKRKRIVVLGAGYAGMFFATNLDSYIDNGQPAETLIIDRNPYHQLLQEIHLVAAGFRTKDQVRIPVLSLISGKDIKFLQSDVNMIYPEKNQVVAGTQTIDYDFLVIALGASTRYFNIEGAEENTLPLRSIADASLIYDKIQQFKNKQEFDKSSVNNNIVIVGGGATGCSLAGALSDLLDDVNLSPNFKIVIIEALSTILPGWNEKVIDKAQGILKGKNIQIITKVAVSKVGKNEVVQLSDGSGIISWLTIWTAGVRGFDIKIEPDVEKLRDGRIVVNEFCQSTKYNNLFAIGDIAAVKSPKGNIYPPLAQIAVRQARYLARIIARYMRGLPPDEKFDYEIKAQLLSLGPADYVGIFNNYVISGDMAKIVEEFTKDAYLKSLRSGGSDMVANIYDDDPFSQALAGITFAGFTFNKAIRRLAR